MTPKEKAQALVHRYISLTDGWVYGIKNWEHKKKCALITVDEIIAENQSNSVDNEVAVISGVGYRIGQYWQDVKREIESL